MSEALLEGGKERVRAFAKSTDRNGKARALARRKARRQTASNVAGAIVLRSVSSNLDD